MTRQEELEAELASAEADLANAVVYATMSVGDRAEANANLEKIRAQCRQIHAALVKLKLSKK